MIHNLLRGVAGRIVMALGTIGMVLALSGCAAPPPYPGGYPSGYPMDPALGPFYNGVTPGTGS